MNDLKLEPCPKCGGEAASKDCGYSTFNPRWVECACGFMCHGSVKYWNEVAKALRTKRVPSKSKRRLSDALAHTMSELEMWNLLQGKSADGRRKIKSF